MATKKAKPLGWTKMNDAVRDASEKEAAKLLQDEKAGAGRIEFMLRIYARYNKMRRQREMAEITAAAKNTD
jgi:hypothetical protein